MSFEQQPHGMRSMWQSSPFIPRPVGGGGDFLFVNVILSHRMRMKYPMKT